MNAIARNARSNKKALARKVVGRAVAAGALVRPVQCSQCGDSSGRVEGHHRDYDKPLEVEWLCVKCHRTRHGVGIYTTQYERDHAFWERMRREHPIRWVSSLKFSSPEWLRKFAPEYIDAKSIGSVEL